jgi:hypothetical protein
MMDPAEKRAAWERLKELAGNGRLIPEPRKKFSRKLRSEVLERQDGLCACGCEERIFGRFDIDHIKALELGGTNDASNLVALIPEHHRQKTKADVRSIAKAKRIERREVEGPKAAKLKSKPSWPPPGSRKLVSRPFPTRRPA